jgi:uncharacterized protein YggE
MTLSGKSLKFCLLALVACVNLPGASQLPGGPPPAPHVQASGEAVVTAKPDQARIHIGVVSQAQTALQAAEENARRLNEVLAAIRKELGPKADIKTISYSLDPQQRYPRDGGQPIITGYRASNIVQATIDNLDTVGKVIDVATRSGANEIRNIQFTLRDEQAVRAEALRDAARRAKANAEAMATALGLKVTRILAVMEADRPPIRPMPAVAAMRMAEAAPPTPVEAGTIEVRAAVTLTAEVSQ